MKNFYARGVIFFFLILLVFSGFTPLLAGQGPQEKSEKININTAPAERLQELPRIGEKVAQRIVDFRTKNGKFKTIEDLMKVKGIGEKIFDLIKDRITVGSPEKH